MAVGAVHQLLWQTSFLSGYLQMRRFALVTQGELQGELQRRAVGWEAQGFLSRLLTTGSSTML